MDSRAPDPLARLDQAEQLDGAVALVQQKLQGVLQGEVKEMLKGERWLGHRLHPLLTDAAIGFFGSAVVLDLLGGRGSAKAARRLVGLGIVSSVPTAAAGAVDWMDGDEEVKRTGLVHAGLNSAALLLFVRSWSRRRRGHRIRGAVYGLLGASVMGAGGYLGGHLTYKLGSGVQRIEGPAETETETDLTQMSREADAVVGIAVVESGFLVEEEEPLSPPLPPDPRLP
jgi:uncharacterized membrane protein